ncbi:MAG TPA: cyclic nucleotide-binding domain-containing protein [Anaerolineales bacterium]|nr:cyclic nucleotide-binding domain-containing protein [Anaerolineales bacterium]
MGNHHELTSSLQLIPCFRDLEPFQIDRLQQISSLRYVQPGDILFQEGDPEDYLYFVLEGQMAIEMTVPGEGKALMATAEPFDLIGWSSVTPIIRQRTASARAVVNSCLLAVESNKLRQLCEEDHELGYIVMRHLANVIAARLLVTRLQLLAQLSNPTR